MRQLSTEGVTLASSLKHLNQRHRDATLVGDVMSADEIHALRREVARKAMKYCSDNGVNHWDFLEVVES